MSRRRLVVFAALALMLPLPTKLFDGVVPLANLYLTTAIVAAMIVAEGAGGPVVRLLLGFVVGHAALFTVGLAALAWLVDRFALARCSPTTARRLIAAAAMVGLGITLAFDVYTTPLGRTPTANLIGALS